MIDQALLQNSTNEDGSHSSHEDNRRNIQTARPYYYADFMKCQPLNFKGTKGVVKFATCTLLDAALTWWNSQLRSLGPDAYSMNWEVIKKKMTDKYYPQGEIKKLEIKLWNLKVKENNVSVYTERFQELTLIRTKFVADETEKIDKYVSKLPDNIYGSVKASKPKTLYETIKLANDLMDQKLRTYAESKPPKGKMSPEFTIWGQVRRSRTVGIWPKVLATQMLQMPRGTMGQILREMVVSNVEPQGTSKGTAQS
nr:reverse transcriptase domain-containing protein [Tanacetum cinerariifolium]